MKTSFQVTRHSPVARSMTSNLKTTKATHWTIFMNQLNVVRDCMKALGKLGKEPNVHKAENYLALADATDHIDELFEIVKTYPAEWSEVVAKNINRLAEDLELHPGINQKSVTGEFRHLQELFNKTDELIGILVVVAKEEIAGVLPENRLRKLTQRLDVAEHLAYQAQLVTELLFGFESPEHLWRIEKVAAVLEEMQSCLQDIAKARRALAQRIDTDKKWLPSEYVQLKEAVITARRQLQEALKTISKEKPDAVGSAALQIAGVAPMTLTLSCKWADVAEKRNRQWGLWSDEGSFKDLHGRSIFKAMWEKLQSREVAGKSHIEIFDGFEAQPGWAYEIKINEGDEFRYVFIKDLQVSIKFA